MILAAERSHDVVMARHPTSPRQLHRLAITAIGIALCVLCACTSSEERCRAGQAQAQQAWGAYLTELQAHKAKLTEEQAEAQRAMRKMASRLGAIATEQTNRLYDQGAAWQRQYEVEMQLACRKDPECAPVEKAKIRLASEGATLEQRIALVTAARNQAIQAAPGAWDAAKAVEVDRSAPLSVAANAAARSAAESCGLTPE